jgi:hypothetical protein
LDLGILGSFRDFSRGGGKLSLVLALPGSLTIIFGGKASSSAFGIFVLGICDESSLLRFLRRFHKGLMNLYLAAE